MNEAAIYHIPSDTIQQFQSLDAKVDEAEGNGLAARWTFGKQLLSVLTELEYGQTDKYIESLSLILKKSSSELYRRLRAAKEYPHVTMFLAKYRTWDSFVNPNLPANKPKQQFGSKFGGESKPAPKGKRRLIVHVYQIDDKAQSHKGKYLEVVEDADKSSQLTWQQTLEYVVVSELSPKGSKYFKVEKEGDL